jgi:hypothetical protein
MLQKLSTALSCARANGVTSICSEVVGEGRTTPPYWQGPYRYYCLSVFLTKNILRNETIKRIF